MCVEGKGGVKNHPQQLGIPGGGSRCAVHLNRRKAVKLNRPWGKEGGCRLWCREAHANLLRPRCHFTSGGVEVGRDVMEIDVGGGRMVIVGVCDIDLRRGGQLTDEEVEDDGANHRALRDTHLLFPPFRSDSLIKDADSPVSKVGGDPTLEVWMEGRGGDFVDKLVIINDVEGARKVAAEEPRPESRLPLVETARDGGGQRKECGDGRPSRTKAMLGGTRLKRRGQVRQKQSLEDLDLRTKQADRPIGFTSVSRLPRLHDGYDGGRTPDRRRFGSLDRQVEQASEKANRVATQMLQMKRREAIWTDRRRILSLTNRLRDECRRERSVSMVKGGAEQRRRRKSRLTALSRNVVSGNQIKCFTVFYTNVAFFLAPFTVHILL